MIKTVSIIPLVVISGIATQLRNIKRAFDQHQAEQVKEMGLFQVLHGATVPEFSGIAGHVFDDGPQPAVQLVQDETITAETEWQQYWIPVCGDMLDDVPASTAQHLPSTNASDANTECDPRKLVEDLQKWALGNNIHF